VVDADHVHNAYLDERKVPTGGVHGSAAGESSFGRNGWSGGRHLDGKSRYGDRDSAAGRMIRPCVLGLCGVPPIRRTLIGRVETISAQCRLAALLSISCDKCSLLTQFR
jgi:hypothetical protein